MDIIKPFVTTSLLFALIMLMLFLAKYFRAVSEKNKCPLSQESFKIEMSKAFKEYFYKKVVSNCWTGKCKLFCR